MMHSRTALFKLVLTLLGFSLLIPSYGTAAEISSCQAFEIVSPGNETYNDLVCQAIRDFEQRDYAASARRLEKAAFINLFEFPNFKILPLLALAHDRAGNRQNAIDYLEQARLALLIVNGEIECMETGSGFDLRRNDQAFEHPSKSEVIARMCGAAYGPIYRMQSLRTALWRAELVSRFLEIKREITGE